MKRSPKPVRTGPPGQRTARSKGWFAIVVMIVSIVTGTISALVLRKQNNAVLAGPGEPLGQVTYHRDIAPIIHAHCSPCHHPGEAAPFDLLTYTDVRKRSRQIGEVTLNRIMPPWLPAPGKFPFEGDRSLSESEIELIQRWMAQGAPEGSPSDAPPRPIWKDGWQLGVPDLVLQMREPYTVQAEGPDLYRNFVIPIGNTERRYVRAIELNPGNSRVVHHAFMLLDPTPESRERDAAEPGVGFDGLHTPHSAQPPEGHFLSWQPGKRPMSEAGGFAWLLETGSDLVLQMHLRPGGKPEPLRASLGLYFTNQPPARTPFKMGMRSFTLDIPAGDAAHWATERLAIPVDVDVFSILPHAHYLAREFQAIARLPDGQEHRLLSIPRWDFSWQGDYTYRQPVFLPKGSTIEMRFRYDNSSGNPENPNSPPRRVKYGLRSEDEMAELWLQVLPRNPAELPELVQSYRPRVMKEALLYNQFRLAGNPRDARALTEIGKVHLSQNQLGEAMSSLRKAVEFGPDLDEAHYYLGLLYRVQADFGAARNAFARTIALNPRHARAHGNLGLVARELGDAAAARTHFQEALRLNPRDEIAQRNLRELSPEDLRENP